MAGQMGFSPASEVTVVIPAHIARVRNGMLKRALDSVWAQTAPPAAVAVAIDHHGEGAAITRQRALDSVHTRFVAFLDSDDELLPQHLQRLTETADALNASFVYSWFESIGQADPLGHFGIPFNPHAPHHTTMTVLCETAIAQEIGFTPPRPGERFGNEDWLFIIQYAQIAVERGLLMTHLAERTWRYNYHPGNTSGMPHLGDGTP